MELVPPTIDSIAIEYSRCDIVDADDFPEGDYELEFDGHRVLLSKKGGHYLARG